MNNFNNLDHLPKYLQILRGIKGLYEFHFIRNFVSGEEFNNRLSICEKCNLLSEYPGHFTKNTRCGYCGCSLLKKLSLDNQKCPKNKW